MINVLFNVYDDSKLLSILAVPVSEYYSEHGYPDYFSKENNDEDYKILSFIKSKFPSVTSFMVQ